MNDNRPIVTLLTGTLIMILIIVVVIATEAGSINRTLRRIEIDLYAFSQQRTERVERKVVEEKEQGSPLDLIPYEEGEVK